MVELTPSPFMIAATQIVADLSRPMDEPERYARLLDALLILVPCDAVALLRLEGSVLNPLSTRGFSGDILGRRFAVAEHPRLAAILSRVSPTRFAADSPLPDPYDGLIDVPHGALEVHDCLGCVVMVQDRPWGVLTLDNMEPGHFDDLSVLRLQAFASLAAAAVVVAEHIDLLNARVEFFQHAEGVERGEMVGVSGPYQRLLSEIGMVADSDLTVLITGPTGVGKELVAEALHRGSARRERPLIRVNCAALPESLAESELFGHVRGAFSGALEARRGKFEVADGATLFLDEIGELPLSIQPKLLRVLQGGHLQRLGSDREHRVDVRVIAATNRDLSSEVAAGRFRADLYHRLSVYPLPVLGLSQRPEDILPIAGYVLGRYRSRLGVRNLRLSEGASRVLRGYSWPGNVRELEHVLRRAALRAAREGARDGAIVTIEASMLDIGEDTSDFFPASGSEVRSVLSRAVSSPNAPGDASGEGGLRARTDAFQRAYIERALQRHDGVWSAVALELELDPANLHRLAKRLGMK